MSSFTKICLGLGVATLVVAFTGSIGFIVFPTMILSYVGLGLVQLGIWGPKLLNVIRDTRKNYKGALEEKEAANTSI